MVYVFSPANCHFYDYKLIQVIRGAVACLSSKTPGLQVRHLRITRMNRAGKWRKICAISTKQSISILYIKFEKKTPFQCCSVKGCSGLSLSLWVQPHWDAQSALKGQGCFKLRILESEHSPCHCTRTHRLIQKYTLNEVTELRLKWLKCIVWAQKICQQSLKIALLRSVKFGEIIQENDTGGTQTQQLIWA